jgi:tRNA modification GTPase TrmE
MHFNLFDEGTICAIATPPAMGAIAIIRVSGPESHRIVSELFQRQGKPLDAKSLVSHKAYFGHVDDENGFLDEVLVTFFKGPHSYTGEDSAEISMHGSTFIQQRMMELLFNKGARMAEAGEFTLRAFSHHRFDLAQAEAVADLISSKSRSAHDLAAKQMRGGYSDTIKSLRRQLIDFSALIELELDFAEEDVEFADRNHFYELLAKLKKEIQSLMDSFHAGNVIKNGIPVAIIGRPNVGKSTLLNALLNEDKAIVSDIPGTTRDSIEDTLVLGGYTFRIIDTAGIRKDADDVIEQMGIERSYNKMRQADIVLYLADATQFQASELEDFREIINNKNKHFILVVNKTDLVSQSELTIPNEITTIYISAKQKTNIEQLTQKLISLAGEMVNYQDTIVSNERHYQALQQALKSLQTVEDGFREGLPSDLASIDLHIALDALSTITGEEITNDEILGTIFEKFCIGK